MAATPQDKPLDQLERYEGYLGSDPGNANLLARCVDLALAAGLPQRAEAHAKAALERYPDDEFFAARYANVLLAQRRWADAAAVLQPLQCRHPGEFALGFNLASAYSWLGRYDEAWRVLEPVTDVAMSEGEAASLAVRIQHHRGAVDAAMELADRAMAACGEHPSFLGAASAAYFDGGRLEDAMRCCEHALDGARRPLEALVISGSLALGAGDATAAKQRFSEVIAHHPDEGRALNGMGIAGMLEGDFDGASRYLRQALERMPGHIGTWHALAWSRLFAKDLDGAGAAFARALELDHNLADSHGGMAVVHAMRGQREEAEAAIARALRLDRTSLAAVFARLVLDGETADSTRFREIALRLLSARPALPGMTVADLARRVQRH